MQLEYNKLFTLKDLNATTLVHAYTEKECCLLIVDKYLCEVDTFYLDYNNTLIENIKSIFKDNNYINNRFYLLYSYYSK